MCSANFVMEIIVLIYLFLSIIYSISICQFRAESDIGARQALLWVLVVNRFSFAASFKELYPNSVVYPLRKIGILSDLKSKSKKT